MADRWDGMEWDDEEGRGVGGLHSIDGSLDDLVNPMTSWLSGR